MQRFSLTPEKKPQPKIYFYTENHIQSEILTYLLLAKKIMKNYSKEHLDYKDE